MTAQAHLDRIQTINQGSFYTPDFIVHLVYQMLLNSISNLQDYVLLDSSCGYGSFLNLEGFKQNIGADIDSIALSDPTRSPYLSMLTHSPMSKEINLGLQNLISSLLLAIHLIMIKPLSCKITLKMLILFLWILNLKREI